MTILERSGFYCKFSVQAVRRDLTVYNLSKYLISGTRFITSREGMLNIN